MFLSLKGLLEAVSLCIAFGVVMFLAYCLLMVGYGSFSAGGIDDFRKDVISIVKLLFEKGYSADQVFDILEFYCNSSRKLRCKVEPSYRRIFYKIGCSILSNITETGIFL